MSRRRVQSRKSQHAAAATVRRDGHGGPWRLGLIAAAVFLVYANSLTAPFIFDDELSVVSNPAIRSIGRAWSQPDNTPLAGRPVAGFSFALNFAFAELDPAPYRAVNVVIHLFCAWLLFAVVRRTLEIRAPDTPLGRNASNIALAAAMLWAVHPLTTDAVTYVTQRTESLMALFYLLTLYASLRAWYSARSGWTAIAISACALGMGSKEAMATAPLTVVLFDRVFLFSSLREALARRARLYAGLALTWLLLLAEVISSPRSGSAGFSSGVSVWTYLLNQTRVIARYLKLAFWPSDLVINYGPPVNYGLAHVLPYAALVIALLVLTIATFRWNRALAFLAAWFFITLAPASSVVPIATEVAAERRMYLPLMGIATGVTVLGATALTRRLPGWRLAAPSLAAAVALALAGATAVRNSEHHSWLTLATTTLERWPSDVAHAMVGIELARLRRDEEALPLLQIGARSDIRARYNLGVTLFNLQRYEEAARELNVLVNAAPMREEVPWARRLMGHAYGRLGRWPEAIAQLRMVLAMTPHDEQARRLLIDTYGGYGVHLAERQRFDEAIAQFRSGLELDPDSPVLRYNLATALFDAGRLDESLAEAQRARDLDGRNADAYHLLGKLLALKGNYQEGLLHLETAAKLNPGDATIRDDLDKLRRFARRN